MDRRRYIEAAGAAVLGSVLAGCAASSPGEPSGENDANDGETEEPDSNGAETGTLATSVTDRPADIDDFESCVVTIDGIWVKPSNADEGDEVETGNETDGDEPGDSEGDAQANESGESDDADEPGEAEEGSEGEDEGDEGAPADESEGRRYIEFEEPQEADLVRLQGANTQLIDETELAIGPYRYVQLDVSGVAGVLEGGGEAEVETPGNAPLQFKRRFEIRADERTRFVADFAPIRRGQGERYLLRPVARGTQVLYGDEEYDPEAGDGGDESEEGDERGGTPDDAGD